VFARQLEISKTAVEPYDVRRAIPPNLYEIFALFRRNGEVNYDLIHSAIVVDAGLPVMVADHDLQGSTIRIDPLPKFLRRQKGDYIALFPEAVIEKCSQMADFVDYYGAFPIFD
jgi:hypothetical protein